MSFTQRPAQKTEIVLCIMAERTSVADSGMRAFLADSLALWRVAGEIEAGQAPVVAIIRTDSGAVVRVERTAVQKTGFRWFVHSRAGDAAPGERSRPCGSLVGLLNAIRSALGVDRGTAVRIAPAPEERPPLR